MIDTTIKHKVKTGKITVNTTDSASAIFDLNDTINCKIHYSATTLTGVGTDAYVIFSKIETSDDNFTTIKETFNEDKFFNSSNQKTANATPIANSKVLATAVEKAIGLQDIAHKSARYIKFYFKAGTNASEIVYSIISDSRNPINI